MQRIEVTDQDFHRLQRYAEPLVDTATTAFTKVLNLLDGFAEAKKENLSPQERTICSVPVFGPGSIPPLTHTKVMAGSFGGKSPDKAAWDALVRLALETLFEAFRDIKMVRGSSGANIMPGQKTDEGYKYLPIFGFSYQGVSAEDAVEIIVRSARVLDTEAWVDFVWRDKPEAHRPGERGRIEI